MKHLLSMGLLGPSREEAREQIFQVINHTLNIAIPQLNCYRHNRIMPFSNEVGGVDDAAVLFEEPSSRTVNATDMAFRVIGYSSNLRIVGSSSSLYKGESLTDAARVLINDGATILVIRSAVEGFGLHLAYCLERDDFQKTIVNNKVSIIIAGAGTRDHSTQVMLDKVAIILRKLKLSLNDVSEIRDTYWISESELRKVVFETFDNLKMAFVGDLRHSRVTHDWLKVAKWFDMKFILVSPDLDACRIEEWCTPPTAAVVYELEAAKSADIVYTIRFQKERLEKSVDKDKLEEIIRSLQIGPEFISDKSFQGEIMDAQPIDKAIPMILPKIRVHSRVITDLQTWAGVPTRMAVAEICANNQSQDSGFFKSEPYVFASDDIITISDWQTQWQRVGQRRGTHDLEVNPIANGTVVDRLDWGKVGFIHQINIAAGLYPKVNHRGVIQFGGAESKSMEMKDIMFLPNREVPDWLAAVYAVFCPKTRLSYMNSSVNGPGGYRRVEPSLPKEVSDILICLNEKCVCNTEPEAKTLFYVSGEKGNVTLKCAYCYRPYTAEQLSSAFTG